MLLASLLAGALAAAGLGAGVPAQADTAPPAGLPATVSADALPTWQINGVVWSQVLVGNTVYATGSFTKARPPGVAVGGAGEVAAGNIFAYDIRTGNRVSTFSHSLNGQGRAITASPDGTRIYVGGDFTTVDNVVRGHVAAFHTATGALDTSFAPNVSNQVRALAASPSTLYIGGGYGAVNSTTRSNLAAVSATTGALLPWAPKAEGGTVWSMVLAPDGSRVIVGGSFTSLSGTPAYGMGSVSTTGVIMPWEANQAIRSAGAKGAITSLRTDGRQIYGTGYSFDIPTANFEGTFAADPATGKISVVNDCHGDTYDVLPLGSVMYSVGHPHDCTPVGSFPDTEPRVRWQRALAQTTAPTTTNTGPDAYGWNFDGQPASTILQWFPSIPAGTYTGQGQAAWSMAGNSDYIVMGGEFPKVNGVAQQGLTRMARPALAPNKVGPTYSTNPSRPVPATTAYSFAAGTARVAFGTAWDYDNELLTYEVLRNNGATPVFTTQIKSNFWTVPSAGFTDTGLAPGSTHSYQVRIKDSAGNLLWSPRSNAVTISSASQGQYAKDVAADGAAHFWRLGEPSGPTAYDWTAFDDLSLSGGFTRGEAGAITGDTDGASSFDGSTGTATDPNAIVGPDVFSQEAWFKTTSTSGGKIVGFGDQKTGNSSSYDRHIYMDAAGRVYFGVYNNGVFTTRTTNALNDGAWHHVVSTLDATGLTLYVDGKKASHSSATTAAQRYTGYWRVGGDNLNGWGADGAYFNGVIDDVAIYANSLTADQVAKHYTDSGRTVAVPPTPSDTYGLAVYNSNPDSFWRLGESSGSVASDATPHEANGLYSGGVTTRTGGAITGTTNTSVTLNGFDGAVASANGVSNPTVYSEELWFKTTTQQGGKLIGFGAAQTGSSPGYDRHVYMFDDGRLRFGVWTGQTNVIDSDRAYNDGTWHHVVATQGPDGMTMYVDSVLVGTNPQTQAQAYDGYWRVGGDNTWGGNSSNYFAGSIDEVAIYSHPLSAATVKNHYLSGGGTVPNQPPAAAFTSSSAGLKASFDASGSTDADGSIASYAWDFGDDSAAGTGATLSHTYSAAGAYTVRLTVTDAKGATDTVTREVTVAPAPNATPVAAFTSTSTALTASFDGSASDDADGQIASYAWDFGDDSAAGTGATLSHTYGAPGTYLVKLTVTDDKGATATVSHDVTVAAANKAPVAAFTSSLTLRKASFDGAASNDPDGTVASYAWDFGDNSVAGTGGTTSHTYAAAGTYSVTLTVTDDKGATASVSHDVTVTAVAADAFGRTVSNGWGSADVGGAWTNSSTAANFGVAGAGGTIKTSAASGPSVYLKGISAKDVDLTSSFRYDKPATGGGIYTSMVTRRIGTSDYRVTVRAMATTTTLALVRTTDGTETTLSTQTVPGLVYSSGDVLKVRFQAQGTGSTTLRARVWKSTAAEPSTWLTATDATAALQNPGAVGVYNYLSGSATNAPVTLSVRDFEVQALR